MSCPEKEPRTVTTSEHPTTAILDRLLTGELSGEESKWAVAHLLGRCEVCSRYLRGALDGKRPWAEAAGAYDEIFEASWAACCAGSAGIQAERLEAAVLWATIEGTPAGLRLRMVEGDARCHTWALASRFASASDATMFKSICPLRTSSAPPARFSIALSPA